MKEKIKELYELIPLVEKLLIRVVSLIGWITILVYTIKGLLNELLG